MRKTVQQEIRELRQYIVDTVSCSFCGARIGERCHSYSEAVGTCERLEPHAVRAKKARRG